MRFFISFFVLLQPENKKIKDIIMLKELLANLLSYSQSVSCKILHSCNLAILQDMLP